MPLLSFLPLGLQPVSNSRRQFNRSYFLVLARSYAADWILTLLIWGLFYLLDRIHGFWREFSLTDTSIQHTYSPNQRVSMGALVAYSVIIPGILILLVTVLLRRSLWDAHNGILGLVVSLAVSQVLTIITKVLVGRPRPDLIARCLPSEGAANAAVFGLVNASICTQTDYDVLRDGFRSFFSGHASLAFAGLAYLTLFLSGKMHIFDKRGSTVKLWIAVFPLFGATFIAYSRTMDYRHHATDVIAGGLVGLVTAYLAYRQYYPSLAHPRSDLPYAPRVGHQAGESPFEGHIFLDDSASTNPSFAHSNHTGLPLTNSDHIHGSHPPTSGPAYQNVTYGSPQKTYAPSSSFPPSQPQYATAPTNQVPPHNAAAVERPAQ